MTLGQLAETLGLPPRQVRYLIAEGVVPAAKALGRGADGFDDTHVAAGLAFKTLAAEGHGVRKVKAMLDARAQLAAMVVEGEAMAGRRGLRFGPLEIRVDEAGLAGLTDLQFDGVLAAVRDRLAAIRAPVTTRPPAAPRRRPRQEDEA